MPAVSAPVSKIAQARAAFLAGDTKVAFRIVSGFFSGLSREELATFKDGYEAHLYPQFFRQIGKDPFAAVVSASRLFRDKYLED